MNTGPRESEETAAGGSPDELAELDAILARRWIHPVFQPIVDLGTGKPVAFEALSRGPAGSHLQRPDQLFAAARVAGRVDELDRVCRGRALESVLESALRGPFTVFVNREPSAASLDAPPAVQRQVLRQRGLRTVVEFTERDLSRDPSMLLAFAAKLRAAGVGIALDDVGVEADSLALMPFLMPDVIKLDMGLVQRSPDAAAARVVSAVRAHAERRGAVILAEGIESEEHERLAVAMGATLGQGWRYGRPGPLPAVGDVLPDAGRPLVLRDPEEELAAATPFEMVTRQTPPLRASAALLFALRQELEAGVEAMAGLAVVLLTCIDAPDISSECAHHYLALASSARMASALGSEMPDELVPGLTGSRLRPGDPVGDEWDLVVVSPHFAAAIIAKERDDAHPEEGRAFDYVLTYDRTLVVDVARTLMRRALPLEQPAAIDAVLAAHQSGAAAPAIAVDLTPASFAELSASAS